MVIDVQRELSKARQVRAEIDATGKPIVAVILTHPHPDHFGGIGVFAPHGSGVPVYGSAQTRDSIAQDRFGLVKASHEVVGDDFPATFTLPDRLTVDGEIIHAAGLLLQLREWGEGEAECMTIVHLPAERALFCADVIQDRMAAFLLEGRSAAWLDQLGRLAFGPSLDPSRCPEWALSGPAPRPDEEPEADQISVPSANVSASSTSTPR